MNRKATKKVPVARRPAAVTEPEMVQEEIMPFVLRHEDEIVNYIKEKAIKETMKSLAPLLQKLEEAVKQQEAAPAASPSSEVPAMNYEEQLKKLQEASTAKLRQKEIKIVDRMNKLNARFGNLRP